ncbi:unnamed protein product [Durusdinium trenchii]|uniref:Uncharacterized protein n=1 Tax=Durusdinium trenchii TaxID=1381693 RepID=A0ABP0SGW4_9DINO
MVSSQRKRSQTFGTHLRVLQDSERRKIYDTFGTDLGRIGRLLILLGLVAVVLYFADAKPRGTCRGASRIPCQNRPGKHSMFARKRAEGEAVQENYMYSQTLINMH